MSTIFDILADSVIIRQRNVENKIGIDVPRDTNERSANFQLKGSEVKVTGPKNLTKLALCLFSGDRSSAGGSGADCKLGLRHC